MTKFKGFWDITRKRTLLLLHSYLESCGGSFARLCSPQARFRAGNSRGIASWVEIHKYHNARLINILITQFKQPYEKNLIIIVINHDICLVRKSNDYPSLLWKYYQSSKKRHKSNKQLSKWKINYNKAKSLNVLINERYLYDATYLSPVEWTYLRHFIVNTFLSFTFINY